MSDQYHPALKCYVEFLKYNYSVGLGDLRMREGSCVDMAGCIALFEAIDPNVCEIHTWSGPRHDTVYIHENGKWNAYPA